VIGEMYGLPESVPAGSKVYYQAQMYHAGLSYDWTCMYCKNESDEIEL